MNYWNWPGLNGHIEKISEARLRYSAHYIGLVRTVTLDE